jgi:hypothetical protein
MTSEREGLKATLTKAENMKATFEKLLPDAKDPETRNWIEASLKQLDQCIAACKMVLEMGDAAWVKPGQT